jgi:hypothetical protein
MNAEPILELRAENTVSLVGFSRHREAVRVHRERGSHPNLGGTTDFSIVRPKLIFIGLGLFVFKNKKEVNKL